uniref:Protein krueppel n=1 Tax=Bracon brevicornis TaxID=1563983 RepID=A0A6V7HL16_9HYME
MNDELPKLICQNCVYKLDEMVDFREKCCETESLLMKMLKNFQSGAHSINREMAKSIDESLADVCSIEAKEMALEDEDADDDNGADQHHHHHDFSHDNCGEDRDSDNTVIHTIQVVNNDLNPTNSDHQGDIQHQANAIVVNGVDNCLDDRTVAMVDEHISQQVSDHQITMHLEGNITIVDQFGINYVTTIDSNSPSHQEIADYCGDVKYETVIVKDEYQQLHERLNTQKIDTNRVILNKTTGVTDVQTHHSPDINNDCRLPSNSPTRSNSISKISTYMPKNIEDKIIGSKDTPSTSQSLMKTIQLDLATEYTESNKNDLLEATLSNPTMDETGINWYVCPFCSEATTEANHLVDHFNQHFSMCACGISFTNVDDFNNHKNAECDSIKLRKVNPDNSETIKPTDIALAPDATNSTDENNKKPQSVNNNRQKWTPKICSQCGKQYRTNYKLQEHMRKHTGEKPFKCLICEKAFRSKIGLAQHTATHTGKFDYNCSTCGKGFQCKSYLIVHQRVHSDLKPYPCDTCGQNFKTKQSLLDHRNRHLGVKPYTCEICGRGFITKGLCKSHQKIHSGTDNRQYPCQVCNKMFVSKSYLNTHLRIHTGEKPYLCEVCGKGFLTRVDLRIHSTMHTGEKSFKCEMCSKVFARRAALRCHRRSHTGERPYRCDICGKTFTQFSPMAIHKRLHTGERPYRCDVCEKTFVSRSTMMCHRKKHHSPPTLPSNVETHIEPDNNPNITQ